MPFRLPHSLLRVEERALQSIDTSSSEELMGMWLIFSRASHALEEGKRLENLSWRLWNHETFCCPGSPARSPRGSPTAEAVAPSSSPTMPALSSSLDSVDEHEAEEASLPTTTTTTTTTPPTPKAFSERPRSLSRGGEKHITPTELQTLVSSIKENKQLGPIDSPMASSPATAEPSHSTSLPASDTHYAEERMASDDKSTPSHPSHSHVNLLESSASTMDTVDTAGTRSSQAQTVGSEDSMNTELSTHSIVRGFVPGGAPSSYRSQTHLPTQPTPILKTSPQLRQAPPKKKAPVFTIGTSSGEEESSLDSHMAKTSFKSSLSESLRRPAANSTESSDSKKQTTLKDELAIGRAVESQDSPVFDSEDEDDEVSESAIEEDDDSSDWEDSDDQSGPSSVNERDLFQRVDSRPNLTSRRSLLTTLIHEPDRAKVLQNAASRSTPAMRRSRLTPNGPSVAASPDPGAHLPAPGQGEDATRPKPIIMTTSNTHAQLALSPRTTRRNMLSTELTESLRKNLLWERQHRSTGNLAALKRRHTAQDMTKLRQYPEPVTLSNPAGSHGYSNDYFNAGLQEYHARGW